MLVRAFCIQKAFPLEPTLVMTAGETNRFKAKASVFSTRAVGIGPSLKKLKACQALNARHLMMLLIFYRINFANCQSTIPVGPTSDVTGKCEPQAGG